MIFTIHTVHCLQDDSNIASLDMFCHLHVLSPQVLHQFRFIQSWPKYRISSWQTIITVAQKYLMNWSFENKNCSQMPCGVKENGIAVSLTTAKKGALGECRRSSVLQVDGPPHSLGWVQHSQAPEPSSYDLKAGVVGCEILKIKKLIFFQGMVQESLCSYFQLQHPGSAIRTREPGDLWLEPGLHLSQAVNFRAPSCLLSKRHCSREPCMQGTPTCCCGATALRVLRSPRANQPRSWLWRAGLGRPRCLCLSSFL